jgi:hypothetical protein
MTTITTIMLVLGMLTSAGANIMWRTAVVDNDTYNLRSSIRIAAAGQVCSASAILLWLGADHAPSIPMAVLLIATTAAAAGAPRATGLAPRPQTPGFG